jgi:hypothetical protein
VLAHLFSGMTQYSNQSVMVYAFIALYTKLKTLLPLLCILQGVDLLVPSIFKRIILSVCLSVFIHFYSPFVCDLTVCWVVFPYPSLIYVRTCCLCNSFVSKFCIFLTSFEIVKLSVCCMSTLGVRHFKAYIVKSELPAQVLYFIH